MPMKFYLVQRLESRRPVLDASRGFDAYFTLDYMGSAEFEWGAVPKALKSMRRKPASIESVTVDFPAGARTVHFVGPRGVSENAEPMAEWARGEGGRRYPFFGKEWTHFDHAVAGEAYPYSRADAWWDLQNDVAWSLDKHVATQLARAFNTKATR